MSDVSPDRIGIELSRILGDYATSIHTKYLFMMYVKIRIREKPRSK